MSTTVTPTTPQRRMERGRMVYYRQTADADYWDTHWNIPKIDQLYAWAKQTVEKVRARFLYLPIQPGDVIELTAHP